MYNVSLDNVRIDLPSTWNELTADQLLKVSVVSLMQIPEIEKKIRIIIHFLKLEHRILSFNERNYLLFGRYRYLRWLVPGAIRRGKVKHLADEDLFYLTETQNYLFKEVTLTDQKLPVLLRKYYGPDSGFSNLSFIEFAKADIRFRKYAASENEQYLDEMIAVLYRRKTKWYGLKKLLGFNCEPREKYSDLCIKNAGSFHNLSRGAKRAILYYWEGCYASMVSMFPRVFSGNSADDDAFGFAGMITELAGAKFGNPDQTAETNLYTILIHLESVCIENEKLKNRTEK